MHPDNQAPERHRPVPFTIDGQSFTTDDREQPAADLLRVAGLDPAQYDLGELRGGDRPKTRRYDDDDVVRIRRNARFVSIRQQADVA